MHAYNKHDSTNWCFMLQTKVCKIWRLIVQSSRKMCQVQKNFVSKTIDKNIIEICTSNSNEKNYLLHNTCQFQKCQKKRYKLN